jgi:ABC-type polar amino acid transport system ATPase subunit
MHDFASTGMTMIVATRQMGFAREAAGSVVIMDGAVLSAAASPGRSQQPLRGKRPADSQQSPLNGTTTA